VEFLALNLSKLFAPDNIFFELKSSSKNGVIEELIDLLVQAGRLRDREAALRAILEREQKVSTGMENGIAIPHGKTDSVDSLVVCLGLKREGIDFASLDGQPAQIFILTLSPSNRTGPHIQFLAEITRILSETAAREGILKARSAEEVIDLLSRS